MHFIHYALFTNWLHLHPHWGGVAAFLIAFAESIAFIGTFIPGSITMMAIGILAGAGIIPVWVVLLFAILGAIAGDSCSYLLGYVFKGNLQKKWLFKKYPNILIKGEKFFEKHGTLSVFIGRFVGPVRAMIPIIAGMLNMRPRLYFLASIPSAILWAPLYMLPGFLLGAISLEMPADVAAELIFFVLTLLIIIWAVAKTINYLYDKTHSYFSNLLDREWQTWSKQPSKHWFCVLLKHAGREHQRGQLLLAINFLIASLLFAVLYLNVIFHGPLLAWNHAIYHLFRGLRTQTLDRIMITATLFGYGKFLLILTFVITLWLLIRKHWNTALHWFFGCGLLFVAVKVFKSLYYNPRPIGIVKQALSSSFPSGHTTLSVGIYSLLAYFICINLPKTYRKPIVWLTIAICALIGISRLYLGAHWFTDVLGGTFLGLFCSALIIISYRRYQKDELRPLSLFLIALITMVLAVSIDLHFAFKKMLKASQCTWPEQQMSLTTWWNQHAHCLPLYRTNRLGKPIQLLNVQWAGNINAIYTTLKLHGWNTLNSEDYFSTLKIISKQKTLEHQSLFPPLYLDQKPTLTLIKFVQQQSPPLILRLWNSHIVSVGKHQPLWVGTVYYDIPHKHLFVFHSYVRPVEIEFAANTLFPSLTDYSWQVRIVTTKDLPKIKSDHRIILIRPRKRS
ncbi:MAG: VTT domain-containing protein [Gammaproteobacteria bacterium]|nr:VTT domain-containing protein [Gammaproteobacteria bacterium]